MYTLVPMSVNPLLISLNWTQIEPLTSHLGRRHGTIYNFPDRLVRHPYPHDSIGRTFTKV